MLGKKRCIASCMLVAALVFLAKLHTVSYAAYEGTDFMIALDVSGSMKDTDKERYSIETIKAVIDLCGEEDRIGVVAYNDEIVYTSELMAFSTDSEKETKKNQIDDITFSGETDIGLGISRVVSLLEKRENTERKAVLIVLSDGETDLENSETGRTEEDSDNDVEAGMQYFMEHDIKVYAIGFQNGYAGSMKQLSLLCTATGGSSMVVADPFELMVKVTEIIRDYQWEIEEEIESTMEPAPSQTEVAMEPVESNNPPETSGAKEFNLYVGEQTVYYDLNTLFQDKDGDRLSYVLTNGDEVGNNIALEGSVLKINPVEAGEFCIKILATDTLGETAEAEVRLVCLSSWKKHETYLIVAVIVGILLVTAAICILLIYCMGKQKRKDQNKKFSGFLYGTFIDLKSKNERPDVKWDLAQYSDDGVSLQELFLHVNMKEDLPQLERLCLYPSSKKELLLVHCMDGGVFVDNRNISANVPAKVCSGETIYISFADNASELALRYESEQQTSGLEQS